jgi:hypothetical protein
MSLAGTPPAARALHSAIFTGTQMIVWGGRPNTASGGAYCACPNPQTYYRDLDADGYGNPAVSTPTCDGSLPSGYVADATDCNDADLAIHPGATEQCNGIDDDCNGVLPAIEADADLDGFRACSGDCDDTNADVHPGAIEINDGPRQPVPGISRLRVGRRDLGRLEVPDARRQDDTLLAIPVRRNGLQGCPISLPRSSRGLPDILDGSLVRRRRRFPASRWNFLLPRSGGRTEPR